MKLKDFLKENWDGLAWWTLMMFFNLFCLIYFAYCYTSARDMLSDVSGEENPCRDTLAKKCGLKITEKDYTIVKNVSLAGLLFFTAGTAACVFLAYDQITDVMKGKSTGFMGSSSKSGEGGSGARTRTSKELGSDYVSNKGEDAVKKSIAQRVLKGENLSKDEKNALEFFSSSSDIAAVGAAIGSLRSGDSNLSADQKAALIYKLDPNDAKMLFDGVRLALEAKGVRTLDLQGKIERALGQKSMTDVRKMINDIRTKMPTNNSGLISQIGSADGEQLLNLLNVAVSGSNLEQALAKGVNQSVVVNKILQNDVDDTSVIAWLKSKLGTTSDISLATDEDKINVLAQLASRVNYTPQEKLDVLNLILRAKNMQPLGRIDTSKIPTISQPQWQQISKNLDKFISETTKYLRNEDDRKMYITSFLQRDPERVLKSLMSSQFAPLFSCTSPDLETNPFEASACLEKYKAKQSLTDGERAEFIRAFNALERFGFTKEDLSDALQKYVPETRTDNSSIPTMPPTEPSIPVAPAAVPAADAVPAPAAQTDAPPQVAGFQRRRSRRR